MLGISSGLLYLSGLYTVTHRTVTLETAAAPALPSKQEPLYLKLDDPSQQITEDGDCEVTLAVTGDHSAGLFLSFGSSDLMQVFMRRVRGVPHDGSELAALGQQTAKRQRM